MDQSIQQFGGVADFWFFLRYPPAGIWTPADSLPAVEAIDTPFNAYMTSPYKARMTFAFIWDAGWLRYPPYPNFPTFNGGALGDFRYLPALAADTASYFSDPQYQRIDGLPLIGLFNSSLMTVAEWNVFLGITGPCFVVIMDKNTAQATALGAAALGTYGPAGGLPAGAGQQPWSAQAAKNVANATPVGFNTVASLTLLQDQRPRNGAFTTVYVDQASQADLLTHIVQMLTIKVSGVKPKLNLVYNFDEYFEGGPGINPNIQEGTRYLDGLKWARARIEPQLTEWTIPSTYSYGLDCHQMNFVLGGTWAYQTQIFGAWNTDEMVSTTDGDTISLTLDNWTDYEIRGTTGPGLGTLQVFVDAVLVDTVSTAAGSTTRKALLSSGSFAKGTHTVMVKHVGATELRIDYYGITYDPR